MRCRSETGTLPLRIGIVNYLNSRPLAWSFLKGTVSGRFGAQLLSPAEVADRLAAGQLEAGLIPSIEVQRIPGVQVLENLSVAATHEVRSVILLSRRPARQIRRLALDENSRTSAVLSRIVLKERYGVEPACISLAPDLEVMMERADAAVIIGDPALRVDRTGYRVLDLAAEWRALTGRPFVFAVWGVRRGVDPSLIAAELQRSLELGLAEMDALVEEAARDLDLEPAAVRGYLTENLSYGLGESELAGLDEFFRRAHNLGLIASPVPIRLVGSCGESGDSLK